MSAEWFAIRAVAGQEKKVLSYLKSEIERLKLNHLIHKLLIPTEKVYEVKNGKKVAKERTYLPGYILIEAETQPKEILDGKVMKMKDLLHPEVMQAIKDVPGVVGFVGTERGKTPVPLRESEINRILGKVNEPDDSIEAGGLTFEVGEMIKVMEGPFSGFTASIDEVLEDKKKLKVIVKIFGRDTPMELNYMQVERI